MALILKIPNDYNVEVDRGFGLLLTLFYYIPIQIVVGFHTVVVRRAVGISILEMARPNIAETRQCQCNYLS
jgi:hypothetical protein